MLLPLDMRDWVPQDDMVHFVIAVVDPPFPFRSGESMPV